MFKSTRKRIQNHGYDIELSPKAIKFLADLGYEPQYGARPMKRVLQKEVVNELSKHMLSGTFDPGDTILVDISKKKILTFTKKKKRKKTVKVTDK